RLIMLTGDNEAVAKAIAGPLGIDEVAAGLLPEHKIEEVRKLMATYGTVAMVGDGVNDAPALAAATVGIAMGAGGTDVALEAADIALMGDDLSKLPFAVGLSRAARKIIVQNVVMSLGVVALLVPFAALGVVPLGIAVLMHEGSTVVVAFNALRLLAYKDRP
ncbi:MAG: HAD-IC family P-type ATPase, partial [Planctomycetota bacterium]|nr:HAD-IC family P-type ATPase [Planctomycetota bacterium]